MTCPKCGAPVAVAEPDRVVVRGPHDLIVDSEAVTKVQDAAGSSSPAAPSPSLELKKSREDSKQRFQDEGTASPWVLDLHRPSESSPVQASEWVAKSAQRSRQVLLVGLLALGGILVSALAFIAFMNSIRNSKPPALSDSVVSQRDTDLSKLPNEKAERNTPPLAMDGNVNSGDASSAKAANSVITKNWQDVLPGEIAGGNPSSSQTAQEQATVPAVPLPSTNATPSPEETPQSGGTEFAVSPNENSTPSNAGLGNVPRGLWDPSMNDLLSEAGSDGSTSLPAKQFVDLGEMIHPPAAPDVNPDDWYSMRIVGLRADQRPLPDILGALAQLAGVGIGVDIESFLAAGVPLDIPISCEISNVNVATFVQTIFEPMEFGIRNLPNGLPVLFVDPEVISAKVPTRVDLGEVLKGREPAAFEALFKESLEEESTFLRIEGSELLLDDRATPIQRYRIFALAMRIGKALGCTMAIDYPDGTFDLGWGVGDALDRFRRPCSGLIDRPKPVAQLLRQAASQHEIQMLFDWPSLWSHGMTPATRGLSLLQHRSLEQVLHRYQEEFALDAAILGPTTVVLTTPRSRRMFAQWKVVPIPQGKSIEEMHLALTDLAPVDMNQVSRLLVRPIFDSGYAVVRICPPTVRELDELANWIR